MSGRIQQTAKFIWLNIGIALLVLVLIEGAARAGFALLDRGRHLGLAGPVAAERRFGPDANVDQGWLTDYRELLDSQQGEWHPYVYWRTRAYRGKHLNINEAGIRRTWNSTASPLPGQLKIFMFGGSTLWGQGARDEFTIPSLVSKKLANRLDSGVWVVNFAENGYVSTQEVITLMLELRKGNVPDVVVFFDGVNDTFSAFQSGVAGIPQNENNRVAEFDSLKRLNWRQGILERLGLYRLGAGVVRFLGVSRPPRFSRSDRLPPDALARAVVSVYLHNVSIVDALAQRFGFQALFFWQPTVFTKKRLSLREQQWYGQFWSRFGGSGPLFGKVYGAFRERIRTNTVDNIYDLSGIFDEASNTVFIDEFHIVEAGNEKIAAAIVETLLRELVRQETN